MKEKETYTIAEISVLFHLQPSTLRYYEQEHLLEPVAKNAGGHRRYGPKEIRRIRFIQNLRQAGVSIAAIRRYVDLVYEGTETIPVRKQLLIDQLEQLKEQERNLHQTIAELSELIDSFEDTLIRREMKIRSEETDAYTRRKEK